MKNILYSNSSIEPEKSSQSHKRRENFSPGRSVGVRPYLQIQSIPVTQRINPAENAYILLILPYRIRACGGQYLADEAHEIAKITKRWDWSLDPNGRPCCLPQLERLLDSICKRSAVKGGEA